MLPLLMAAGVVLYDRTASSPERRIEAALILLFGVGVAGSGIGGFTGHFFLPDPVADSIGWARGSPFQLEMAFANLALGILGILAVHRRDGFREATVIAVVVVGLGASVVHLMDYMATGNSAPGNTLQNVGNLIKPAFLVPLLFASRRIAQNDPAHARRADLDAWRTPIAGAAFLTVGIVGTAFGIGFAVDRLVEMSMIGTVAALAIAARVVAKSRASRNLISGARS